MREYEILVVTEINDAINGEAKAKTKEILASYKADIFHEEDFGVHELSFIIKGVRQGKYFFYHFKLEESKNLTQIEKELRYEHSILRFIIVRLDEVKRRMAKKESERKSSDEESVGNKASVIEEQA